MGVKDLIEEGVKNELDKLENENEERYKEVKQSIETIRKLLG